MSTVTLNNHEIDLSKQDKVLFPDSGITKGELVDYYRRIAETMLRHTRDRPISMHRYPDGLGGTDFYQKDVPDYFPDWIDRTEVAVKSGSPQDQVVISDAATLVYLANQAVITPHIWPCRGDKLDYPDRMVFDFDPSGSTDKLRDAARRTRDLLEDIGLVALLQTTGSRGYHVVVPLDRSSTFDEVRDVAAKAARLLASRHNFLTVEQRKNRRGDRIFVDYLRNAYGQTMVTPYAVRARPGAPVATPIDWDELGHVDPQSYTIENIFKRLGSKDDPWKTINRQGRSLEGPAIELDQLIDNETD